jgi:hypothetical protein
MYVQFWTKCWMQTSDVAIMTVCRWACSTECFHGDHVQEQIWIEINTYFFFKKRVCSLTNQHKNTLTLAVFSLQIKAMLHGAIFLATGNAILLLRDVKLPNTSLHYTPLMFSQHIEHSSLISLINISQE